MDTEQRRNLRYTRGPQKPVDIDSDKMDAKAKKDAEKAAAKAKKDAEKAAAKAKKDAEKAAAKGNKGKK